MAGVTVVAINALIARAERDGKAMYLTDGAVSGLTGIAESTLRVAMGRSKGKEQCPCCGQVVREGFEIDRSVLKEQP